MSWRWLLAIFEKRSKYIQDSFIYLWWLFSLFWKNWIHLADLPPLFERSNFCDFLFVFRPLLKKIYTLRGKNLLPNGSKFFPLRADPLQMGHKNTFDRGSHPETVLIPYKFQNTDTKSLLTNIHLSKPLEIIVLLLYTTYTADVTIS